MMMQKLLFSSYIVTLLAIFSWVILVYGFCLTRSHESMLLQMRRHGERAMLLEWWLNVESSFGELGDISLVQAKLPKKLKKRRQMVYEDGPAGYVN